MKFSIEEAKMILAGLQMYKKKLGKMLKDSETLKVAEKDIKDSFLKTDKLIERITLENK